MIKGGGCTVLSSEEVGGQYGAVTKWKNSMSIITIVNI